MSINTYCFHKSFVTRFLQNFIYALVLSISQTSLNKGMDNIGSMFSTKISALYRPAFVIAISCPSLAALLSSENNLCSLNPDQAGHIWIQTVQHLDGIPEIIL